MFGLQLLAAVVSAQTRLEMLAPESDLVAGESFRLQYIWRSQQDTDHFSEPRFDQWRRVKGPSVSHTPLQDEAGTIQHVVSYVLVPEKPGQFQLPAATVWIRDQSYSSASQTVQAITREEWQRRLQEQNQFRKGNPNLFLAPGEDPQQKIKGGLFLTVEVDRRTCRVGQPVLATYKLYSCLHSQSDIVKNPGFYGFAVQEMLGLADQVKETRQVNGRWYEVHTLRKVQLYPQSAGTLIVDPMEVACEIAFSKKPIQQTPRQIIGEGVYKKEAIESGPDWDVFNYTTSTSPVAIQVSELPAKGRPAQWAGAVGRFRIRLALDQKEVHAQSATDLLVEVSGKGNFQQLTTPRLTWPQGLEGFEPRITDQLEKMDVPVSGTRTFRVPFVAREPGQYTLPAVEFSYFNTDSNRYVTVRSNELAIEVLPALVVANSKEAAPESEPVNPSRIYLVVIVTLVITGVLITWRKESKKAANSTVAVETPPPPPLIRPSDVLPSTTSFEGGEQVFYRQLYQGIWSFLSERLSLNGTALNKQVLRQALASKIAEEDWQQLNDVLETCEMGLYTGAHTEVEKTDLLHRATAVLERLDAQLA